MNPQDDAELSDQWRWNLTNHTPNEEGIRRIEQLRRDAKQLVASIINNCPAGRERSLALTLAEQSSMYAVAAVARDPKYSQDKKG